METSAGSEITANDESRAGLAGGFVRQPDRIAAKRGQHRRDDRIGVESGLGILLLGLVVILESVGEAKRPKLEAAVDQSFVRREGQDMRAEPADRAFLD